MTKYPATSFGKISLNHEASNSESNVATRVCGGRVSGVYTRDSTLQFADKMERPEKKYREEEKNRETMREREEDSERGLVSRLCRAGTIWKPDISAADARL